MDRFLELGCLSIMSASLFYKKLSWLNKKVKKQVSLKEYLYIYSTDAGIYAKLYLSAVKRLSKLEVLLFSARTNRD